MPNRSPWTAGSGTSITCTGKATTVGFAFGSYRRVGFTNWQSGTWTVKIEIETGNTGATFHSIYVCRLNSSGVSQETLGSLTGLTEEVTAGTHTFNISCSGTTAASSDNWYVVFVFNVGGHSDASFTVDPQAWEIDCPG